VAYLNRGVLAAFHCGVRLGQTRRFHNLRWGSGKSGNFYFANLAREINCTEIHLFCNVISDNIDNKLPGAPDIASRVLGKILLISPVGYTHTKNGRVYT